MTLPSPTPATGGRTGAAAHGEAGFIELDALAVAENREATIDINLRYERAGTHLDLVRGVPFLIVQWQLFQRRLFLAQECFR